jgi:flavin reductase (DIM6/NTAB) family NADH-FMN oxidoreductase RutF
MTDKTFSRRSFLSAAAVLGVAATGRAYPTQSLSSEDGSGLFAPEQVQSRSFGELFKEIDATKIQGDVFTLVSKNYAILTAGTPTKYNSMVTGWGGWGILFSKPAAFSFLRSNRYTLELMRQQKKYTVTFFDEAYKNDLMIFGTKSGRNSNKMKEHKLTAVQTPSGNMAYKEAKLIFDCDLIEVTTVSPDDFLTAEGRKFVTDAHAETGAYHKMVFGQITKVWAKK